jgi:hypothetical protein
LQTASVLQLGDSLDRILQNDVAELARSRNIVTEERTARFHEEGNYERNMTTLITESLLMVSYAWPRMAGFHSQPDVSCFGIVLNCTKSTSVLCAARNCAGQLGEHALSKVLSHR